MDIYKDEISRFVHELEDTLEKYIVEHDELPEGHLICSMNNGRQQFFQVDMSDGNYRRTCINRRPELIRKYARKEFLAKAIASLEHNIKLLKKTCSNMMSTDPSDILMSMRKAYKRLPEDSFFDPGSLPLFMSNDDVMNKRIKKHADWANSSYNMSRYMTEHRNKPTSRGLYVRSKSEQLIAEMLYRYGIPFRYEQVIPIGLSEFSADFTFEAADGSEFFWEHAGMMDEPSYVEKHLRKLLTYQKAGILPGSNLLISYDRDGNTNMSTVESMIQNEVIPRL